MKIFILTLLLLFCGCENISRMDCSPENVIEIENFGKFYLKEHRFIGNENEAIFFLIIKDKFNQAVIESMRQALDEINK